MKKFYYAIGAIALIALAYFVVVPAFAGRLFISPSINLGPLVIRWYGLIMAAAILTGYFVCRKHSWRFGIAESEVDNFSFWVVIVSFFGARLYYVLFAWNYFSGNITETFKVWHGGLSIYGALISGLIFSYLWARKKAYSFKQLFDLMALSLPLAQAIGRWGNFINQEAYGLPTNLPWRMYVDPQFRPFAFVNFSYFHPTFLYESVLLLITFFVLIKLIGKLKPGVLGLVYLGIYSLVRFLIEPLRLDSVWIGNLRADQIVALLIVMISGIVILRWQFGLWSKQTEH